MKLNNRTKNTTTNTWAIHAISSPRGLNPDNNSSKFIVTLLPILPRNHINEPQIK
jgi:hypothetical protein